MPWISTGAVCSAAQDRHGGDTCLAPASGAARAGVRSGDVLLDYRGTTLQSVTDLGPLLGQPGRAAVTRWRDGERQSLSVEPGPLGVRFDTRPAAEAVRAWRDAEEVPRGET